MENKKTNASIIEILKIYGYVMKLNLKKRKRDMNLIDKEYNSGKWKRPVEQIDFETVFGNYDRKDTDEFSIFSINDQLKKIKRRQFEELYQKEFLSFFKNYTQDQIIELGCGLGANLFGLYNNGFKNLNGCDVSNNAINNLKEYTRMKKINIDFFVHDLNNQFPQNTLDGKIVFTKTVMEQCKHIMPKVLQNICNGNPKIVIHFEVNYDSASLLVRKYFDARDYQNNLIKELKKLEKQKNIDILAIEKLKYQGSPVNKLSVVIWKPVSR